MSVKNYLNDIVCGDSIDLMKTMEENSVNLTVTSPPYDNLRSYKGYEFDALAMAKELYRITKPGGIVVWVIGDATVQGSETGTSFRQALGFMDAGFNLHDTMIFNKKNPIPQIYRKRYNNQFEYMFVFSKGTVDIHNPIMVDCAHAGLKLNGTTYKNYSKHEQKRGKLAKPVKDKKIKGNIWSYVVGKNKEDQDAKGHPAPFPCQLVQDHVISWSNKGDIVFDPMCGSGTTCKVAKRLGRNYIGFDISQEYCDLAKNRVAKEQFEESVLFEIENSEYEAEVL